MFHLKYQEVGLSTEIGTGFSFERERPFLLATSHSFLPAFVFLFKLPSSFGYEYDSNLSFCNL